jgi:hypothetical protein
MKMETQVVITLQEKSLMNFMQRKLGNKDNGTIVLAGRDYNSLTEAEKSQYVIDKEVFAIAWELYFDHCYKLYSTSGFSALVTISEAGLKQMFEDVKKMLRTKE